MLKTTARTTLAAIALFAAAVPAVARADGGDLVVPDELSSASPGRVTIVTPGTGAQRVLASGSPFSGDVRVAREPDGNYAVVDYAAFGSGAVFRVNRTTGAITTVSSGGSFQAPFDITIDGGGSFLVADAEAKAIFRVNPATGAQTPVSSGGSLMSPVGIALEASGKILVADNGAQKIFRINPATGAQTVLAQGGYFANPAGIAVAPDGVVFVADSQAFGGTGGVIRVNPTTGAQTRVTSGGLKGAIGIAVRGDGLMFVTNDQPAGPTNVGQIFAINRAGGRLLVAQGDKLVSPEGLAILPNRRASASFKASRRAVRPGRQVTFDASASRDPDGSIVKYAWDLDGDGKFETPTGAVPRVTRSYATPGSRRVRVRVTDSGLTTTVSAARTVKVDGTRPRVTKASASPKAFRLGGRGTRFKYRLSEAARVTFTILRRRGRAALGTIGQRGHAGRNARKFSGKLHGTALSAGRYRARIVAIDAAGNRSRPRTVRFRVR